MNASKNLYLVVTIDNDMSPASFYFITEEQYDKADRETTNIEDFSNELYEAIDENYYGHERLVFKDNDGKEVELGSNVAQNIIRLHEAGYKIIDAVSAFMI